MEAWVQEWSQKCTQKWTQNWTPFGEPRCSETQGIQWGFDLFDLSEGSSFGFIPGLILSSISGPLYFGTFQVFNSSFNCQMNSEKSDFGLNVENLMGGGLIMEILILNGNDYENITKPQ